MVQHDAGLRMCPRFQGGLKFLSRRRLDTCGEIAMRRKIQPLKFLSNEFLTNTSAVQRRWAMITTYLLQGSKRNNDSRKDSCQASPKCRGYMYQDPTKSAFRSPADIYIAVGGIPGPKAAHTSHFMVSGLE